MRRFWFGVIATLVVLDLGAGAYLWWLVQQKAAYSPASALATRPEPAAREGP
jgi:hypothetical protein